MNEEQNIVKNRIKDIAQSIADISYKGHYTIEKYSKSQYRFGFGISESSDIPCMFTGNSVKEAMYRAIDFELMKEVKAINGCNIISRKELMDIADNNQRKREKLEAVIAAGDVKYKKLTKEIDVFRQDREHIINVVNRFKDQWKGNASMKAFGKSVEVWEEKKLSLFIAFLLEYVERQIGQMEMVSHDIPPFEKKEKSLLKGAKILAIFHTGSVFEPVWNEIRDAVMDGKWHTFPEAESIVMKYSDHHLTIGAARQKRQAYFEFARDERYRDLRGGKDYSFEWKRRGGGNTFRFVVVKRESKKSAGSSIDTVNEHSIYEAVDDEFVVLLCDGEYHTYQEAIELFEKYDKYKKYKKKESFYPLIRAYMKHVSKFYWITKIRESGIHKFKFDSKGRKLDGVLVTVENDVKCARCGQIIHCSEQARQVDDMTYHLGCYDILDLR